MDKLVSIFQQTVRRNIVKIKRIMKRRNWRQRIKEQTGKDPMVCKKCQCYYEYKVEVCLEDDKLTVKVALCPNSRAYLEKVINNLTGIKILEKGKEGKHKRKLIKETERQLCLFSV